MTKTQEDFFNKIFTSHFIARVRKGCMGFYCERELETEHNWNILTPKLWPSALCLSRSPGLLNRSHGAHSAWCWLSLLQLVYLPLQLYSTVFLLFNSSAVYYLQTPTRWYGHASTPPQFLPISGDRDVLLPLSLERPVWSSSVSLEATLFWCVSLWEYNGIFFLPHLISSANFRPRDFLS